MSDLASPPRPPLGPPSLRPPTRTTGDPPPAPTAPAPAGIPTATDATDDQSAPAPATATGAALHPRMVARRIAVRRQEGRRRLRRLVTALAVLVVVAALALSTRTPLLDLDHLRIEGASAEVRAAVTEAAVAGGARPGRPLLDIDPARVTAAVQAVPVVASAAVVRRWPGTIVVRVEPRIPVANVGGALVAADGIVVAVGAGSTSLVGLDGVAGPAAAGAVVDEPDLLAVAAALPPPLRTAVAAVRRGPVDGEVDLRLTAGGIARLGPPSDLPSKLVAVATVLEQVDLTCLATIDARVPSAPAVTRAPGCSS